VFQKDQQNVHGTPAQAQGLVGLHDQTLSGIDPVGAEMDGLVGGKGQRVTPAYRRLVRGFRAYSSGFYGNAMRWPDDSAVSAWTAGSPPLFMGSVIIGRDGLEGIAEAFGAPGKINNV
jgi:hypothetical protein